jgi:DNA-binding NtrC family response regulator
MRELARRIHKTRNSKLPVLITGEPGTGKEGIARAIHSLSDRRAGPFVAFNCTIATKELISSQLFGHRKGSFTGADANYLGSIRVAQGGTIFLDEIGDLPLELQPKLLRFLQEGEVHPVGETKPVKVDVRVLTATNRNLEDMVKQGLFREDLYYRINILRYHLPPLRERREEIPALAFHLLDRFSQDVNKTNLTFTPEALAQITVSDWPGNIRHLANEIQRAIALVADEEAIYPHHLWPMTASESKRGGKLDWLDEILQTVPFPSATEPEPPKRTRPRKVSATEQTLAEEVDGLEREIIMETLENLNLNLSHTAKKLGLTRRGLMLKMSRLQIDLKALRKAKAQGAELASSYAIESSQLLDDQN